MKALFDSVSYKCSRTVTKSYSTSFSLAVNLLGPSIRNAIHAIYGFVRFADEIVDSFHDYDKLSLLNKFEQELHEAIENKISLNPILNSFQEVYHNYNLDIEHVNAFMKSMRADLSKSEYSSTNDYKEYIYGSADVVGLMCLKVFVGGDQAKFEELKYSAEKLGSAFQKVNFLRDFKADSEDLDRSYFPEFQGKNLTLTSKNQIVEDIRKDFKIALEGIRKLPKEAKLGVYTAYIYYSSLLYKLAKANVEEIKQSRIRVSNGHKLFLLSRSFVNYKLNIL